MANEFTKPTKVFPAIIGQIADPDVYNQNIAAQSKDAIIPIDENGNYADGDIGDQTVGTVGALITNIKLRVGGLLKFYDAFGVFVNNVNLGQASETLIGQAEIATDAETNTGTDDLRFITPKKLKAGFAISLGTTGYIKFPSWMSGVIIQWGSATAGSGFITTSYPLAFTTVVGFLTAMNRNSYRSFNIDYLSLSQFRLESISVVSTDVRWFAIGY